MAIRNSALTAAVLFACAAAIPLRLQGAAVDPDEQLKRRRSIEVMSTAERDRLERQFKLYREMSPERRAECLRLHQELDADKQQGGNLHNVMQNYHDWLKTLSPWQREELRQTANSEAKLKMIRDFLSDDEGRPSRSRGGRGRPLFPVSGPLADMPTLGGEDLAAISRALEQTPSLPDSIREDLEKQDEPRRILKILAFQAQRGRRGPGGGRDEWLDVERIVEAISDESLLATIDQKSDPEDRRRFVGGLLVKSLMVQWRGESETARPDEKKLQAYYEQLEPGLRDKLMTLPGWEFHDEVRHRYLADNAPLLAEIHDELRTVMHRLWMDHRRNDVFGPRRRPRRPEEGRRHGPGDRERDGRREHGPPPHRRPERDR